jgi:L-histidine N-alpha-methyltransferase
MEKRGDSMATEAHININGPHFDEAEHFRNDVRIGLALPTKELSYKYTLDQTGSELFNEIIHDPKHYPSFCEAQILNEYKNQLSLYLENELCNLIELGPGGGVNSQIIIENLIEGSLPFTYSIIDTSKKYLERVTKEFYTQFPRLKFNPIHANYLSGLQSIDALAKKRNVILFLGSNMGRLNNLYVATFLKQLRRILNSGDYLLISFDMRKNIDLLLEAYNDPNGLYQKLNLNLLARINNELGGHFNLNQFNYKANYNKDIEGIHHFLISKEDQTVEIESLKQSFQFAMNEPIYLGSTSKYREQQILTIAETNGFEVVKMFTDENKGFIVSLWKIEK